VIAERSVLLGGGTSTTSGLGRNLERPTEQPRPPVDEIAAAAVKEIPVVNAVEPCTTRDATLQATVATGDHNPKRPVPTPLS